MSAKFDKEKLIEETNKTLKIDERLSKIDNDATQPSGIDQEKQVTSQETPFPKEEPKVVGIRQQLEEVNEKLDILVPKIKEKKMKPFKLPFNIRGKLKKLGKTNSVLVFILKTNRTIKATTAKIENDFIVIEDKYHNCSTDFIYMWENKYPAIVLPEWDLNPIGTKDYYTAVESKRNVNAQTVIIRAIETATLEEKKKISGMMWIWILLGAAVVGYIIFAGQKK